MQYTSCFIGIPLPNEFKANFRDAANEISAKLPSLETVDLLTPHITMYYLNEQSQLALESVQAKVRKQIGLLAGATVEVGGMGVFGGDMPKVVYVQAECSKPVYRFHAEISKELTTHSAVDNDFGFVPHVTIARIKEADAEAFLEHRDEIGRILSSFSWSFRVTELCLYGVDSRKQPEHQTQLLNFEV
jgi:RNA 2',3'-cyclic 3'-phosphodiesterase